MTVCPQILCSSEGNKQLKSDIISIPKPVELYGSKEHSLGILVEKCKGMKKSLSVSWRNLYGFQYPPVNIKWFLCISNTGKY